MTEITSFQKSSIGQVFFFRWILVNALGGALGWFVAFVIAIVTVVFITVVSPVVNLESQVIFTLAIGTAVLTALITFGVLLGTIQWLFLRKHVFQATWWLFASAAGMIVGSGVGWALGSYPALATIGIVAGAIQWLGLRRQVSQAGWWILVNPIGLITGSYVGGIIFGDVLGQVIGAAEALRRGLIEETDVMRTIIIMIVVVALGLGLVGAIYGIITGRLLVWLLQHPKAETQFTTTNVYSSLDSDGDIPL